VLKNDFVTGHIGNNKLRNNRRGFTLVEMIIAIGVIAIFSGLVLQLFITAKNLNKVSGDLDRSTSVAVSVIETFKMSPDPESFFRNDFFSESDLTPVNGKLTAVTYFDGQWEKIVPAEKDRAVFILTITALDGVTAFNTTDLKVKITITDEYGVESRRGHELISLTASKFYVKEGS
jgi:prepilin-type N-terminal cleavage/methylation domain-containing protein